MERGTWQATVHEVTRAGHNLATWLSNNRCMDKEDMGYIFCIYIHIYVYIYIYTHTHIIEYYSIIIKNEMMSLQQHGWA